MLYRVCANLDYGGEVLRPGAVSRLSGVSAAAIERLLAKGSIRRSGGPPLSELLGWRVRSERLSRLGITSSIDFLEVEPETVATPLGVSPALVRRWQRQVERAITVAPSAGG